MAGLRRLPRWGLAQAQVHFALHLAASSAASPPAPALPPPSLQPCCRRRRVRREEASQGEEGQGPQRAQARHHRLLLLLPGPPRGAPGWLSLVSAPCGAWFPRVERAWCPACRVARAPGFWAGTRGPALALGSPHPAPCSPALRRRSASRRPTPASPWRMWPRCAARAACALCRGWRMRRCAGLCDVRQSRLAGRAVAHRGLRSCQRGPAGAPGLRLAHVRRKEQAWPALTLLPPAPCSGPARRWARNGRRSAQRRRRPMRSGRGWTRWDTLGRCAAVHPTPLPPPGLRLAVGACTSV